MYSLVSRVHQYFSKKCAWANFQMYPPFYLLSSATWHGMGKFPDWITCVTFFFCIFRYHDFHCKNLPLLFVIALKIGQSFKAFIRIYTRVTWLSSPPGHPQYSLKTLITLHHNKNLIFWSKKTILEEKNKCFLFNLNFLNKTQMSGHKGLDKINEPL